MKRKESKENEMTSQVAERRAMQAGEAVRGLEAAELGVWGRPARLEQGVLTLERGPIRGATKATVRMWTCSRSEMGASGGF